MPTTLRESIVDLVWGSMHENLTWDVVRASIFDYITDDVHEVVVDNVSTPAHETVWYSVRNALLQCEVGAVKTYE
jgi:hypothetical protein